MTWNSAAFVAALLAAATALYIRLRWRRAPQAFTAMVAVAACFFVAGAVLGAWSLRFLAPRPAVLGVSSGPAAPTTIDHGTSDHGTSVTAIQPASGAAYTGPKFSATVTNVLDGDTVDVVGPNGAARIRLTGIDAPEHGQAFGSESTKNLAALLSGKSVNLDCENEKSYGRLLCKILLPNGEDVCLDQVKSGMAWHYKQYQDEQSPADQEAYAAAECQAMKAKLGFWSDPHPMQPQDFRHGTNSPPLLDGNGCRKSSEPTSGPVEGNSRSHIFEWPGCPYYGAISSSNEVDFPSPQAAEAAGYRPAHNCP
jgi:endonuclease YncB( thermonuclease family)